MNMAIKKSVLKEHFEAWLASKGDRQKRGALADMLAALLKIHRKSVGRSMRRLQLRDSCTEEHRGRPRMYGNEVIAALSVVWEAMGHPCAEHLTPSALDTHVSFLRQDGSWHYGDDTTTLLLAMSESTKKRHVHTMREK